MQHHVPARHLPNHNASAHHASASRIHHPNRHEVLRGALLTTVDLLAQRRAHQIDETYIDNYVALGWLEWHGGNLRLTTLGSSVCAQMTERLASMHATN